MNPQYHTFVSLKCPTPTLKRKALHTFNAPSNPVDIATRLLSFLPPRWEHQAASTLVLLQFVDELAAGDGDWCQRRSTTSR